MFERFAKEARHVVVEAQLQARAAGSRSIDTRHVLIALAETPGSATTALRAVGMDTAELVAGVRRDLSPDGLDADALASVGIDLDAVRERADAVFGEGALDRPTGRWRGGHIPFTADAKKTLELALREALRLHHSGIDNRDLLLGLLRNVGSPGERALREALTMAGSDVKALRSALEEPEARAS
jgi:ATP-dependent Clp protease ATP-binding subunit ClpA